MESVHAGNLRVDPAQALPLLDDAKRVFQKPPTERADNSFFLMVDTCGSPPALMKDLFLFIECRAWLLVHARALR